MQAGFLLLISIIGIDILYFIIDDINDLKTK